MTDDLFERLERAAAAIAQRAPGVAPRVGLILGSGLGSFADRLDDAVAIPYGDIPRFPTSSVEGHAGALVLGRFDGVPCVAMKGRVHYYEGYDLRDVAFPARVLVRLGARTLIVTNAAGGIRDDLEPGTLMLIRDHINLFGANPLRGPNDPRIGPRFPDMTTAYDAELRELARRAAGDAIALAEGVYAGLPGPSYETPAEVQMLARLGADAAGMSTVPEVIAARHMGARVLGISCITNKAAGLGNATLSHDEVTETAARVRSAFERLLGDILRALGRMA
ncbi:MAG: purine-nucleoside phosphorylase [Deltaproteobacteria bacterium]|nr:MAG: purine-nucleoside phosphorylase [Deltaproteobacteria bacterium]